MPKVNFSFVDNIRCIAILAIVIEHTSFLGSYVYAQSSSAYWPYITSLQLVKFGTIAFFIIGGFLFSENGGSYQLFQYLKRRFDNIFKPWIIWSLLFLCIITAGTALKALQTGVSFKLILSGIWWGVKTVYIHSNYWFIANFFFCTTILLLSKNILRSWKFGFVLFLLTCFYSINIYTEWIPSMHTTALLGFVFFYWLGVQLNIHYKRIEQKIKETSFFWFIALTVGLLAISVLEASFLYDLKKEDPLNTLRFSNVIFSISVFLLLLKIKNFNWIAQLQPRKTTYGIFLIHYILVYSFLPIILGKAEISVMEKFSIADMYIYQFSRFAVVYIASFGLASMLSNSNLSWVVGIKPQTKPTADPAIQVEMQPKSLETEAA
ncbi:MAG: acyltransferase [Pyrinomonadaceae bacterium]|nr:acyltransferase [Sphingobacteriaceae bacterium]